MPPIPRTPLIRPLCRCRLAQRLHKLVDLALAAYEVADGRAELVEGRSKAEGGVEYSLNREHALALVWKDFCDVDIIPSDFIASNFVAANHITCQCCD